MLQEIGPVSHLNTMNGPSPVTWLEIWSYCQVTDYAIEAWEAEIIMRMSRAYITSFTDGNETYSAPPYIPEWAEDD